MYEVIYTGQFKKSLKQCVRRGLDVQAFTTVLDILQEKGQLPTEYRPLAHGGHFRLRPFPLYERFGTRHLYGNRHSPVKPLTATNLMALEIGE